MESNSTLSKAITIAGLCLGILLFTRSEIHAQCNPATNLSVSGNATSCTVSWTASTSINTGYLIICKDNLNNVISTNTTATTVTSFTQSNLIPCTNTYDFSVEPICALGAGNATPAHITYTTGGSAPSWGINADIHPPTTLCQNTTVTFTVDPANGSPGITYAWSVTGTGISIPAASSTTSVSVVLGAAATGGSITVSASNNCGTTAVSLSKTFTVNSVAAVGDPISASGAFEADGIICKPATGQKTFTFTESNVSGTLHWSNTVNPFSTSTSTSTVSTYAVNIDLNSNSGVVALYRTNLGCTSAVVQRTLTLAICKPTIPVFQANAGTPPSGIFHWTLPTGYVTSEWVVDNSPNDPASGSTTTTNQSSLIGCCGYKYCHVRSVVGGQTSAWVTSALTPLAITLLSFDAFNEGPVNILKWSTAKEGEGDNFEIERSENGKDYSVIATLPAKGSYSDYRHADEQPVWGNNYYRLHMTDKAGGHTYSNTAKASSGNEKESILRFAPNPFSNQLIFQRRTQNAATIIIRDYMGRKLIEQQIVGEQSTIPTSVLAPGPYILQYVMDGGIQSYHIIKL